MSAKEWLRPPWRSVRGRLLLATVLVETLMLLLLLGNSMRVLEKQMLEQAQRYSEQITPVMGAALLAPLFQRDYATVQAILNESQRADGLDYITVSDLNGGLVAASGRSDQRPTPMARGSAELHYDNFSSLRYDLHYPIQAFGQTLGILQFGVNLEQIARAQWQLLREGFGIALVEIILSAALLGLLGVWLTRHLGALTKASESVRQGNLTPAPVFEGEDDVGRLGVAFNAMSHAVAERIHELTAARDALSVANQVNEQEHARLSALLSAMNFGVLFVTLEREVLYANPAFYHMWKIDEHLHLQGREVREVFSLCSRNLLTPMSLLDPRLLSTELSAAHADSMELELADGRMVTQVVRVVRDRNQAPIGQLWLYEDVTRERQTAQQLRHMAEHDSLTGLCNRNRLQDELERLVLESQRVSLQVALLCFDLDEFKCVNDNYGHRAGDTVLMRVAGEVSAIVRASDLLVRLGGDEFAVLARHANLEDAQHLAERILHAIAQLPLRVDGQALRLTTSIGIALYPEQANTADELVARADIAMYQAKQAGKNAYRIYSAERDDSHSRLSILSWNERIDRALSSGGLELHFQAVHRVQSGEITHYEALLRMRDSEDSNTLILPNYFIPRAEKSGRIALLDRWVLARAVRTLAERTDIPALAVNISGRTFDEPGLPFYIADLLRGHGVSPTRLLIELTETAAVSDLQAAQRFIEILHRIGCQVCLDDFGVGFSSFAYLKFLGADIIKIDGLFVRDLLVDVDSRLFIKAIVDVARGLGKTTVAEFVESEGVLEQLRQLGVDLAQGYHLGRPLLELPDSRPSL